jgi:hypothetical protein
MELRQYVNIEKAIVIVEDIKKLYSKIVKRINQ